MYGQLPGLLTQARKLLPADDSRRRRLEQLAGVSGCPQLSDCALAAGTSLRGIRGSSTPFGLPVALALLKPRPGR